MAGFDAGSIVAKVKADLTDFNNGINQAKQQTSKLKSYISDATDASKKFAVGMAAVGAAAVGFGVLSVKAFSESEDAIAQLNAVLKSTNGVAGITKETATGLASSLEKVTKFSDEAILQGENLLLTFTNIGKDIFPEATETMLNMSQALGQDLKGSAVQLGKALQDPILGVTALRRVGVNFNESQQEVIRNLVETGRSAEAQALILKELKTEFGGSARAAGQTLAGRLAKLKNQLNNVQEAIGELIVKSIGPLVDSFNTWFDKVGGVDGILKKLGETFEKIKPYFPYIIGAVAGGLVPAFVAFGISVWTSMAPLLPFIALGVALAAGVKALIGHFGGLNNTIAAMQPLINTLAGVFNGVIKPAITSLWNVLVTQLFPALKQLWDFISPMLIPVLKVLAIVIGVTLVAGIWLAINVLKVIIQIISSVISFFVKFKDAVVGVVGSVVGVIKGLGSTISSVFGGIWGWIQSIQNKFSEIVPSIKNSLSNVWDAITGPFRKAFDWVKDAAGGVINKLKDLNPFQRHSPSLFDLVSKGTSAIKEQYADMFGSIGLMATSMKAVNLAPAAVQGVNNDNRINTQIYGSINIGSEVEANNFIGRLTHNQELAARGLAVK